MEDNKNHSGDLSLNDILDEYTPKTNSETADDSDIDKILSEVTGDPVPPRPPRRPPSRPTASDRPEISFGGGKPKPAGRAADEIRSLAKSVPVSAKKRQEHTETPEPAIQEQAAAPAEVGQTEAHPAARESVRENF
ncbi:MAG: hypothetical protein IIZ73_06240, partial [Ruminococcus sp.]|nr:hypothetical protein [Ruminococcus sp.]